MTLPGQRAVAAAAELEQLERELCTCSHAAGDHYYDPVRGALSRGECTRGHCRCERFEPAPPTEE